MPKGLNWERATAREKGRNGVRVIRERASKPRTPPDNLGITNEQAHFLAALQKAAGEPYTGNGMRAKQAAKEIRRLQGDTALVDALIQRAFADGKPPPKLRSHPPQSPQK